jgi:DNA-directed RNA polymerase subunit beta
MMTIKSDDVVGRVKVYESLVKGTPLPKSGVPESFRVLIKEFQALGLDISILNQEGDFVDFKEVENEDDEESYLAPEELEQNSEPEEVNTDEQYEETDDEFDNGLDDIDDAPIEELEAMEGAED